MDQDKGAGIQAISVAERLWGLLSEFFEITGGIPIYTQSDGPSQADYIPGGISSFFAKEQHRFR